MGPRLFFMFKSLYWQENKMMKVRVILKSLISKVTTCSLCFNVDADTFYNLSDEIHLQVNMIAVTDLLHCVLGPDIFEMSTCDLICSTCLTSAINLYNFIIMCKTNSQKFINTVNSLTQTVIDAEQPKECESSFIFFDSDNYVSNIFFNSENSNCFPSNMDVNTHDNEANVKRKSKKVRTEIKCKSCSKSFPQAQNLRAHYLRVHAPKRFKCSECPKKFGSNVILEQHKLGSHSSAVCSECGKLFNNRYSLRQHEKSHGVMLICPDCGRVYKRESTFRKHIQLNICNQKTRKSQTEAVYCCDICKKKYCLKSSLRVHIQFEHGNGKAYVCDWCNKKFSAQSLLKAHTVTHTQEKKFECSFCSGKFVSKESLLYHIRSHTGDKPYKCEKCECRFVSKSRRSDHFKKFHRQELPCRKCFLKDLSTH